MTDRGPDLEELLDPNPDPFANTCPRCSGFGDYEGETCRVCSGTGTRSAHLPGEMK